MAETYGIYCTFEELKSYRGIDLDKHGEDSLLKTFCRSASGLWDRLCLGRTFYPRIETRYYDHPADDRVLKLDDDLLEVTTFTTQNTGVTVISGQYYLMCGGAYNMTPYDRIVMKSDGTRPNLLYSGTVQKANAVAGVWGYHDNYASAWRNTGDTLAASMTSGATTFSATSVSGSDVLGESPRFRVQHLLKIDSELLFVTAISTNTVTVRRAVNGSTAAAHDSGATVYRWSPVEDVFEQVRELAAYLYQLKDSQVFDVIAMPEAGQMVVPKGVPTGVKIAALAYRRITL